MSRLILAVVLVSCTPVSVPHRIPLPPVSASSRITIQAAGTETTRTLARDQSGEAIRDPSGNAIVTSQSTTSSDRYVTAYLDGRPLPYGALIILGNPQFDDDVAAYARLSRGCRRGRPLLLYGTIGLGVGGITSAVGSGSDNNAVLISGLAVLGAGVAMLAIGVQQGAFSCGRVLEEKLPSGATRLEIGADDHAKTMVIDRPEHARELADRFNMRR